MQAMEANCRFLLRCSCATSTALSSSSLDVKISTNKAPPHVRKLITVNKCQQSKKPFQYYTMLIVNRVQANINNKQTFIGSSCKHSKYMENNKFMKIKIGTTAVPLS